ncbi:hypothetical protein [Bradyrhizobium sp. NP1]|uniref:hypothetical protein n=1 Tax=Bradyrhizobium sp. NP1 TaxID=3049772 RepID=UPI0033972030
MDSLLGRAFGALALVVLAMAALLFGTAGTWRYWQAWAFLSLYLLCSFAIIVYLMTYDPALLERRMRGGPFAEKTPAQKIIMAFASLGFIGLLAVPGLDHRFAWSHMPAYAAIAGDVLVLLGLLGTLVVFRENSFAAATIEVAAEQRVISSGP